MRLWHEHLISKLPRQQLLGQHRECAALRGKSWNRLHSTVNYVFSHPYEKLFYYYYLFMQEMMKRGYNVSPEWLDPQYRGKNCEKKEESLNIDYDWLKEKEETIYPEHDMHYLEECIANLRRKGVFLS